MPAFRRAFVLAGGIAVQAGCGESTAPVTPAPPDPVDLSAEWSVAAPEAEQVDGVRLSAALDGAGELLGPLGIHARNWELDNRQIPNGGAGLYFRPRDMAKIGQLVLQRGRSGARAVVPAEWIDEVTSRHLGTGTPLGALGVLDYGDLWWLGAANGHRVVPAWGHGGQFIYVVPDLALVVVTTATWEGIGGDAHAQETAIANLIVNGISPTIQ